MTLMKTSLFSEVAKFRHSSAFTPGDSFSFSVAFDGGVALPGKFDPARYLDNLGCVVKGRVAVVCAANGGLCVELLRRGADKVVAFEPRNQYFKALEQVSGFAQKSLDKTFEVELRLPEATDKPFDLIIWPEGLEDIRDPLKPLRDTIALIAPGGRLFIETTHGAHGPNPVRINSWRPTQEAFAATIAQSANCKMVRDLRGRHGNRQIHEIESFFLQQKPGAEEATVETFVGPSADTMDEIAHFSAELKATLMQTTGIPKALLEQPQPTEAPAPAAETQEPTAGPAEASEATPKKARRSRKAR